jgi:hypothetical protein
MTGKRRKTETAVLSIIAIILSGCFQLSGQDNKNQGQPGSSSVKSQNTVKPAFKNDIRTEPVDTNFTFEKYADFLKKISDTSKYIVVPLDEYLKNFDSNKIVIGLRHDVDNDLKVAQRFSATEKNLGFRSTYYILHTAPYYLADPSNKAVHNDSILPILKDMQDSGHFEIGWHNDLITLQVVYHIDPVSFLHQELDWLRKNGIRVVGSSSHGSSYCRVYYYINFYFFEECTWPIVKPFVNNVTVPDATGAKSNIKKGKLSDFGLEYEAYFLNNNKYFSDASITNGVRWNIGMLDLSALKKGDRVIILLHPIHWHQAYTEARFAEFRIPGQWSSTIDPEKRTIKITMPAGTDLKNLCPYFVLPSGAYSKANGVPQTSSVSRLNFSKPVTYTVVAENRAISKDWTVSVEVSH